MFSDLSEDWQEKPQNIPAFMLGRYLCTQFAAAQGH